MFKGQFDCLGENTEKYKTFSVPIEKMVMILYNYILQNKIY